MSEMADLDERKESRGLAAATAAAVGGALVVGGAAALAYAFCSDVAEDPEVSPELKQMNVLDAERLRKFPDPSARTRQRYTLLLANSLDVPTVAKLLRESMITTEDRITSRRLYAFDSRAGWRIPAFQFVNGRVIRNLDRVAPRFRRDLHPLEVVNWFHHENPDLQLNAEPVSPIAWLQSGADPSRVVKLAEVLGRSA